MRLSCNLHIWQTYRPADPAPAQQIESVIDFIHVRFWDVVADPFQSITGGGTLL